MHLAGARGLAGRGDGYPGFQRHSDSSRRPARCQDCSPEHRPPAGHVPWYSGPFRSAAAAAAADNHTEHTFYSAVGCHRNRRILLGFIQNAVSSPAAAAANTHHVCVVYISIA